MTLPQTVAIEQLEEALEDGQLDHSSRASLLFLLAKAFHMRFYSHGAITDVEAAIKKYHEAVAYHGDADPELPRFTMHLANAYVDKHEETREEESLVQPIQYIENALKLIPKRHDDRPKFHRFLTNAYMRRYQQTAQGADLNLAIQNARALLSSVTPYGEDTISMRKALCHLYYTKCLDGDLSDLDAAVESLQGLLQMIGDDDKEDMSFYQELLADLYKLKYDISKSSEDLHSVIRSRRISAAMSHNDDPKKGLKHHSLGVLLMGAFRKEGDVAYLDESLPNLLTKLSLTTETSPGRLQLLSDIAIVYAEIHHATDQNEMMEKCLDMVRQAMGIIHASHPDYEYLLKTLHDGHLILYSLKGSRADFESWLLGPPSIAFLHDADNQGPLTQAESSETLERVVKFRIEDPDMFALNAASDHGHNDYLRKILGRVAEIDSESPEYSRAIARAAIRGHTDTVQLLIEAVSNLHQNAQLISPAIQYVASTAYTATANVLIQYGGNIEARKAETRETPLHIASRSGQIDMVRLLLEKGANVNAIIDRVETAFYIASSQGDLELARLLHAHGADISIGHPLHVAAYAGHLDFAKLLVSWGADVNLRDERDNFPLNVAASYGHAAIACILLDNGADINATVAEECSSLFLSVLFQHHETMQLLLCKGADAKRRTSRGYTPLHAAAWNGNIPITRALIQHGCDLSARDAAGRTPLHNACIAGHKSAAMELLSHKRLGIDVADRFGSTPLSMAARHGHRSVVEHLLECEIALDMKDCFGRTALCWARRESHTEAADNILQSTRLKGIVEEDKCEMAPNSSRRGTTEYGPTYQACDVCTLPTRQGMYWHCSLCNSGDFDICPECVDAGAHCFVTDHKLARSTTMPK
ncbi:unnamed protein product [Clonostachys solani]|uniref:Uncharacterized protein n=1 Tax=Clonostachys solani TaxID=160281 RepID=A0A9P0EQM9_9HYPO|nr:unnamed protein product [Clonostachys solani]